MSKKNGIDIMSPLQRDKYFESLSDSGVQALIDDPEESEEVKNLAKQHQAMRKQQKEEELIGQQAAGKGKNMKNTIDAAEAFVTIGDKEVSVADIIARNNALETENADMKAKLNPPAPAKGKDNAAGDPPAGDPPAGDPPPAKGKDDEIPGSKPGDGKPKDAEKQVCNKCGKVHDGECAPVPVKNAKHFVKLNSLKENAADLQLAAVDTLHSKVDRGANRYGSGK